jgi:hypothetical protein
MDRTGQPENNVIGRISPSFDPMIFLTTFFEKVKHTYFLKKKVFWSDHQIFFQNLTFFFEKKIPTSVKPRGWGTKRVVLGKIPIFLRKSHFFLTHLATLPHI